MFMHIFNVPPFFGPLDVVSGGNIFQIHADPVNVNYRIFFCYGSRPVD